MKVMVYRFSNIHISCVGSDSSINDLDNYLEIHKSYTKPYDLDIFTERIINNGVYASAKYIESKSFIKSLNFNIKMFLHHLFLSESGFDEAMVILHPDKIKELLCVSDELIASITKHSVWNTRFK